MDAQERLQSQDIGSALRQALNRQGHSFHYAVLKEIQDLSESENCPWVFEAAEFPVEVQETHTHIDFILRHRSLRLYLIAECKRANPALSDWCFVRTPYYRRNQKKGRVVAEQIAATAYGSSRLQIRMHSGTTLLTHSQRLYHLGLEVRSARQGDAGNGRGAIMKAATQVCRGLNGLVEYFSSHPSLSLTRTPEGARAWFLPVIFTTARIWTSEVDLGSAALATGELETGATEVAERSWIWLQYHLSPGLKHTLAPAQEPAELGDVLDLQYVRTVAVVNSSGIADFLAQEWDSLWG